MNCPFSECGAELTEIGPIEGGQTITCPSCQGAIEVEDDADGLFLLAVEDAEDGDGSDDDADEEECDECQS